METENEYYNTTYPPLYSDEGQMYESDVANEDVIGQPGNSPNIQKSENIPSADSNQDISEVQTKVNRSKKRQKSLYDEDMYSLPTPTQGKWNFLLWHSSLS